MNIKKWIPSFLLASVISGGLVNHFIGRTDPEGAAKVAEQMGFHDVQITGKASPLAVRGYYRTRFSATSTQGKKVTGIVSQDMFGSAARLQLDNNN